MGYRSQVVLVLRDDVLKRFIDSYSVKFLVDSLDDTEQLLIKEDASGNKWHLFYWDFVKWYPEYPEVAAIQNFLTELDNEDMSDAYSFTRIGEEDNDAEYSGTHYTPYAVRIERSISWE